MTATAAATGFAALYAKADAAGRAAAEAAVPAPMIVGTAKSLFDDTIDTTQPTYYVSEGVCGFAWVNIPGNTGFARWAKSAGVARPDSYYKGVTFWVSGFGQSMTRKEAYARAFAAVLTENGIARAYAMSRMD